MWRDERHYTDESYASQTLAKVVLKILGNETARTISDAILADMWEIWSGVLQNFQTYGDLLTEEPAAVPSQDGLPARAPSQDALSGFASSQDELIPMVLGMPPAAPSVDSASSTGTDVVMRGPHVSAPSAASGSASVQQTDAPPERPPSDVAVKLEPEESDVEGPSDRDTRLGVPQTEMGPQGYRCGCTWVDGTNASRTSHAAHYRPPVSLR